jgi:hypothetical protein
MGGNANAGGGLYQVLYALPNVQYTVSCVSEVDAWWWPAAEMRMFFLDTNGNTIIEVVTNCAAGITGYDTGLPWAPYTNTAVSPAGTAQLKVEFACPTGTGTIHFDNAVLTSPLVYPAITSAYPDGSSLMQSTNVFSFTASSPSNAISNIKVVVNGEDVSGSLTVSGPPMSRNVSYGITTNKTYVVNIQVADATGLISVETVSFDTFNASYYTWEAEDWDFNGGQFIDNPQVDTYLGITNSIPGVDYYETSTGTNQASWAYRAGSDPAVAVPQTEITADVKRLQYANTNDYDVGWFDGGEWLNYTRTYPTGLFNVYARMASPGASTLNLSQVTSGVGTSNQTLVSLGNFALQNGLGWSSYSWVPLTDATGNLVKVNLGGVATLRATAGGNANFQFLMLVPANTNAPVITGIYPDGSVQFQNTNSLTFTATSSGGISATNIKVTLNVTNATAHYTTNLTSANGLTVTGSATSKTVSCALLPNTQYSVVLTVTDQNNYMVSINPHFDTYNPVMTWEGEDWDFNNGQYIPNPAVNAYAGLVGNEGVDYHFPNTNGARPYRPTDAPAAGIITDTPRTQYVVANTNDYAVGYFTVGEWLNYTRNFPAGTYNIYGRFSAGGGTSSMSVGLVTNNAGTSGQQTQALGNFTVADTGGWNAYQFTPLRDQFGNLVPVTLSGPETLKVLRTTASDANVNFFMLLPAVTTLPTITQVTPVGWFQSTNKLQFVASATAGIATSNIVVRLNGATASNLSFAGSSTSWNVSCSLAPSTAYTAVITVTDNNRQVATTTVSFDTFSPESYTWEAEDYDYSGGQFIDNPQVDQYFALGGTAGIDFYKVDTNGSPAYRADAVATETNSDFIRPQFATGYYDYDVGYTAAGDWWNYTRTYPAGKYNVYLRAARGAAGAATMGMREVTGGWGTSSQTTVSLGSFALPATGAWQTYAWVPLVDGSGNLSVVTMNGSTNTLRLTDGGGNFNFLLLAPAVALSAAPSGRNIELSFGTQSGFNYTVVYKNSLTDSTWSTLSTVPGDGASHTISDGMSGASRYYRLLAH